MPTFNSAQHVAGAIESVLTQTSTDLELVVADHGSSDATWTLLQSYARDPRVRLMQTPTGGGAERN